MTIKSILPTMVGALLALVVYDMFVKDLVSGKSAFDAGE